MNRKLISLGLAICWLPVSFAATVHLRGRVSNEAGEPVANAVMHVRTLKLLGFGAGNSPAHFSENAKGADKAGEVDMPFQCVSGDFECWVTAPGYYNSTVRQGHYKIRQNAMTVELVETEKSMGFVMRKVKQPIPMIAYPSPIHSKFPTLNGEFAFDLERADWVRPHGIGEVSDLWIACDRVQSNGVDRAKIRLLFKEEGCGAYWCAKDPASVFPSPYEADTNAVFRRAFEFEFRKPGKNGAVDFREGIDPDGIVILRTRVEHDENGKIVKANYAKIYGPLRLWGFFNFGQISFNPVSNDVNLEFDVGKNLRHGVKGNLRP